MGILERIGKAARALSGTGDTGGAPAPGPATYNGGTPVTISSIRLGGWFTPNQPLRPVAPPDVRGRQWDFQVGQNLNFRPRSIERYSFDSLRLLAENCNILRVILERQKDLVCGFAWDIKPRETTPGRRPAAGADAGAITELVDFFQTPDQIQDWQQWLRSILEDLFVIDAVSIYWHPNMAGGLYALEQVDGATIQPLMGGDGRRPQPGDPAFAQILRGVPAGNFTSDELIYYPRSPRVNRLYGMSPVQQIVKTCETAIARLQSQLAYFTAGNITDGIFTGPQDWTTDHVKAWQHYWDSLFEGNLENRRHGWWVPSGVEFHEIKQPALKDEFDEWLARVICFTLGTSPSPFIKAQNRSNAESQQEAAEEGGVATYMSFVKRLMDMLIRRMGHPGLEFVWDTDREFDPQVAAEIDDTRLRNGSVTLDEVRDRNGEEPYPNGIGSKPLIYTASGAVTVEQALEPPPPPPEPAPGAISGGKPAAAGGAVAGKPPPPGKKGAPAPAKPPAKKPAALQKRAVVKVPNDSAKMKLARTKVRKAVHAAFRGAANSIANQVTRKALQLGKAETPARGLYVRRNLTRDTAAALSKWAAEQGFSDLTPMDEMHATIVYSKTPVNLFSRGGEVTVAGGERQVAPLGPNGAVVLHFESDVLRKRHFEARKLGASSDYPDFTPHVTITWNGAGVDLRKVEAYDGPLIFGPELHSPLDEDWKPVLRKAGGDGGEDDEGEKDALEIADGLDLSSLDDLAEALQDPLGDVATAGGRLTLAQAGLPLDDADLTGQVATVAEKWARERAAELVGKRWTKDGELIDNPNPLYAISESTRDMLRGEIADAFANKLSVPQLADRIRAGYAFSQERADLVAHTEVARANVQGSIIGAREAQGAGVALQKVWLGGQDPCEEICQPNIDQGAIDLDDDFESGDDGPPGHPGCFCSLAWDFGDAPDDGAGDE